MKIAFLTHHDPHHRRSWSGILFYMIRTLEEHCGQVVSLGPVGRGWTLTGKVVSRAVRVLRGENIDDSHTIILSRAWASFFQRQSCRMCGRHCFAPVASTEIAFLKTQSAEVRTRSGVATRRQACDVRYSD